MNKIKTYQEFNEEIKWKDIKKAATGVALGAGLALGSPQITKSQTLPTSQTQQQKLPQDQEFSTVIEAPGKNVEQIQEHLYNLMNDIRINLYDADSPIKEINYQPFGKDRIKAEVKFAVSPKNTKGITEAEIDFLIKDGKYKIIVGDIHFIHVGYQPMSGGDEITSRYKPLVGTAASHAVRRAFGGALGGPGEVLGNLAASAIQDWAIRPPKPKKDFELKTTKTDSTSTPEVPKGVTAKNYENYLKQVDAAVQELFGLFREGLKSEHDF